MIAYFIHLVNFVKSRATRVVEGTFGHRMLYIKDPSRNNVAWGVSSDRIPVTIQEFLVTMQLVAHTASEATLSYFYFVYGFFS